MIEYRRYQGLVMWCRFGLLEGRERRLTDGTRLVYGIYGWWPAEQEKS